MNKYPVVKIQFETIVFLENHVYITQALTRVHYLLADNMLQSERYDLGKLRVVLDVKEEEQPYLAEGDVIHMHPLHLLKDIEVTRIKLPFLKPPTRQ